MDPNTFAAIQNSIEANYKSSAPQPKAKPVDKKSWITSLIPAAASILGGTVGTIVAPGVGTAGGGALGGVLGQKLQDVITHHNSGIGTYLGQGAFGSLGGLGDAFSAARGGVEALQAGEGLGSAVNALRFGAKGADAIKAVEATANAGSNINTIKKVLTANAANNPNTSRNVVGRVGGRLEQDVINPKVAPGVGGAAKEAEITAQASKVPGLSAASKYRNLQGSMNKITAEINPILDKSTGTAETSKLLDTIRGNAEQSAHFLAGDPTHEAQLNKVLTDLSAKTGGADQLTARQLFDYKQGMDMNSVFTKLQKGVDLNPKEASRLAVWSSLDKAITKAEPAVKDLTKQQSLLMQSASGLKSNASKVAGIPILGLKSKTAEQVLQSGKTLVGRGLEKVGGATGEAPSTILGLTGQTAKNMAKAQIIPRLAAGQLNPPVDGSTTPSDIPQDQNNSLALPGANPTDATANNPPVDDSQQIQSALRMAALQALQNGDTKGLSNITAIASMFATQDKANATTSTLSKTQQTTVDNANSASSTLDTMLQQLGTIGGGAGRIGGLVGSVKGKLGFNNDVNAFNSTKTDAAIVLAQALSGSTRVPPPSTLKLLENSMPNYDDNPEEAQRKVEILKQRLQAKLSTIPGAAQ